MSAETGPITDSFDRSKLLAVAAASDVQWNEVAPDYGTTWDFDENPTLVGLFVGVREVEQPDMNDETYEAENRPQKMRMANVYEFVGTDQERYAVWGSWSIDNKMQHITPGHVVRIHYKGEESFKDEKNQPRRVKRYSVSVAG